MNFLLYKSSFFYPQNCFDLSFVFFLTMVGFSLFCEIFSKSSFNSGCYIFTYEVEDPREFGVAELDNDGKVISIEEKPENPKSNNAIVGVYVFDGTVINKIKTLKPSARGEYEITDLCDLYIKENNCMNIPLKGWWIDAGTPERIEELESNLL